MYQKRSIKKVVWSVGTVLLFSVAASSYAACQQCNKQMSKNEKMNQPQKSSRMTTRQATLVRAKELIGANVKSIEPASMSARNNMGAMNSRGMKASTKSAMKQRVEKIGTVKDLIFDNAHNRVDWVIVASQGKYYPVPWWAFHVRGVGLQPGTGENYVEDPAVAGRYEENWLTMGVTEGGAPYVANRPTLYLNITREQLREAPAIRFISLERLSQPGLRQEVRSFYAQHVGMGRSRWEHPEMQTAQNNPPQEGSVQGKAQAQAKTFGSPMLVSVADMARASEVIGLKVQDPRYDRVHRLQDALIVARGGNLAYGLVSFGGFLGVADKIAAVPWSSLTIRAPEGFAKLDASRQTLETASINEEDLGRLAQRQYAREIYNDFGVRPYWEVFGFAPGEEMGTSMNAWKAVSSYNKNFDPSKLTTVEGTIESVGTFYPENGATPGTSLNIKTKDGASLVVYAGPRDFTMHKDLALTSGKDISVTGCKTTVNGKSVIIASQLKVQGKTLKLRDQQGKPEWNTNWCSHEQK
jgi:hypothetical protein